MAESSRKRVLRLAPFGGSTIVGQKSSMPRGA
jgi:hypothetical protein